MSATGGARLIAWLAQMAKTTVRLEGLSELRDALRSLKDATAKNVMRRVLKKAGEPIADHMRSLVPTDSGDLKESITVSTQLSKAQRRKAQKEGANDVEVYVGPGAGVQSLYSHLVEFGSSTQSAQPYARPAFDAGAARALERIKDDLKVEIDKAAARAARKAAKKG